MDSSNSDSESECFESAEEDIDDDKDAVNTISNRSFQDRGNELPESVPRCTTTSSINQVKEETSGNLMSYRKRPERVNRQHSKPSNKTTSKSLDEIIFKADKIVSDVFLQDIKSNLSKNINRSLTTLQQTSSNVKGLIFSTIPVSSHGNNEGFSYDDKNLFSPSTDTVLDNKHFHSTENIEDHAKKKEESEQLTKETSFSLADGQSDSVEDIKLSCTGTDNLENSLNEVQKYDSKVAVLKNIIKKEECNFEQLQDLEKPNSAYLNLDDISKGTKDSNEHNEIEITTDKTENSTSPNALQKSLNSEKSEVFKENDLEVMREDNSFTEANECSHNENLDSMKLCIKEEIPEEPKINEKEHAEKQNPLNQKFVSPAVVNNSEKVKENLTDPLVNVEDNGNLVTSAGEDDSTISKEKLEINSKCNLNELKTALKNIIKEEECSLQNINEGFNENLEEGEFIFKGKMVDNETSKEGWDDFDFSDAEDEDVTFKQGNSDTKEECKFMANEQIKKNKETPSDIKSSNNKLKESKCADDILREEHLKMDSTKTSVQAAADKSNVEDQLKKGKSLVKENKKHVSNEIIEIKPVSQDVWDWDTWDEGADSIGEMSTSETKTSKLEEPKEDLLDISKWSGWDNFGQKSEEKPRNWSLGSWGVDMLLNKATTVTQGISSVLEAGLGAPDPETLAKMEKMERENIKEQEKDETEGEKKPMEASKKNSLTNVNLFPVSGITNLVAEVTSKIVEHSKIQEIGSKVLNGGLDTLETFGKKTMEVLQEGDPGLKNKRALLLGDKKPVLSQVLREAREKADRELKKVEERESARKIHFETLFDDFQGMVHLEALEMLSRQYELKLEQLKSGMSSEELEDFSSILEEVEQLCSLDEFDVDLKAASKLDFKIKLQMAVEPLKNEISIQKIIQIHEEVSKWLQMAEMKPSFSLMNQKLVSTIAELAAATVQQFHKSGELLSVKECRKTVEEVDALLRLTNVLCEEINTLCDKFILLSKERGSEIDNEKIDFLPENVTIIMRNSTSYIRQAFNLLIPVLQFGAAVY